MLSITDTFAPAGVLGSGSVAVRPHASAVVRPSLVPSVAVAEGTRVPVAGMARRRAEWALTGVAAAIDGTDLLATNQHDPITQNDGTTPLGIHPRGRSTS